MSDVQASPPALPAELGTRVMEAAPVVILFLDPDGTIRYANPCFEALSGYRLDEIRGKSWFETLLPARDRDRIRVLFPSAIDAASAARLWRMA